VLNIRDRVEALATIPFYRRYCELSLNRLSNTFKIDGEVLMHSVIVKYNETTNSLKKCKQDLISGMDALMLTVSLSHSFRLPIQARDSDAQNSTDHDDPTPFPPLSDLELGIVVQALSYLKTSCPGDDHPSGNSLTQLPRIKGTELLDCLQKVGVSALLLSQMTYGHFHSLATRRFASWSHSYHKAYTIKQGT
jgi:hypothetical protein